MNIKDLKELIANLPDDMQVESFCDCGGDDGTACVVKEVFHWETDKEMEVLWVGGK